MSLVKLNKQLRKPETTPTGSRAYTPAFLSDSKGLYLKNKTVVNHPVNQHIRWWCKSGATIENRYHWLKDNLESQIKLHGNIWLYVWLGTCNLTQKDNRYISLTSYDNSEVDKVKENLIRITELIKEHPGSKVTILELPVYSISRYNKTRRHPDSQKFEDQDKQLDKQVYCLNGIIRELNNTLGAHSPQFSTDIQNHRKVKPSKHPENRNYYNFDLYTDGIHPGHTLASFWLRKISNQILRDCWE